MTAVWQGRLTSNRISGLPDLPRRRHGTRGQSGRCWRGKALPSVATNGGLSGSADVFRLLLSEERRQVFLQDERASGRAFGLGRERLRSWSRRPRRRVEDGPAARRSRRRFTDPSTERIKVRCVFPFQGWRSRFDAVARGNNQCLLCCCSPANLLNQSDEPGALEKQVSEVLQGDFFFSHLFPEVAFRQGDEKKKDF